MSDEGEFRVLLKGEFSSMASSWNEYLCLAKRWDGYVLMRCGYEVLAPLADFEVRDEDGDFVEYQVPGQIDGNAVEGIEGGEYVVGGALVAHDDESEFELDPEDLDGTRDWLALHEWDRRPGFEEAWREIRRVVGTG